MFSSSITSISSITISISMTMVSSSFSMVSIITVCLNLTSIIMISSSSSMFVSVKGWLPPFDPSMMKSGVQAYGIG